MSIVSKPSDIKHLCDCPYTGTTREIKPSAEHDNKKIRTTLQAEINDTKEELIVAKNAVMDTQSKLASLKRILTLELGLDIEPNLTGEPAWKDRIREKSYLKSELIKLADNLRQCDSWFKKDPDIHPTKLSASSEKLLSTAQEEVLKHLYHGYTVYRSKDDKLVGKSLADFLKLKEDYENKLYQNKVMEQEIKATKMKIADYQRRFLEDKFTIDYIANQHFTMKGCFKEVFPERCSSQEASQKETELDPEAQKYKELWEKSKLEKGALRNSALSLKKKLESATHRIMRAENICSDIIIAHQVLAMKVKKGILLSKMSSKKNAEVRKFSITQYASSQKTSLDAALNENRYLRNFLRKAILSKTAELQYYQESLHSYAGKYRKILEGIRSDKMAAEAERQAKLAARLEKPEKKEKPDKKEKKKKK